MQQGLEEARAYFSGENVALNNDRLLVARLSDVALRGGKCQFGFESGKTVEVSIEEGTFRIKVDSSNERQIQILNWLLLSEANLEARLVIVGNGEKLVTQPVWRFSGHLAAAEAVKRVLAFYYAGDQNRKLLDFELPQKTEGCFIATAAYGSGMVGELDLLRKWRDDVLMKTPFGRFCVRIYIKISPYLAKVISQSTFLRAVARAMLHPLITLLKDRRTGH